MRVRVWILAFCLLFGAFTVAEAKGASTGSAPAPSSSEPIEVTADESLEWYQDKNIYVARGNAKATNGDLTVTADLLTAHKREKPKKGQGKQQTKPAGDIDRLTAEGNVVILKSSSRITGDRAIDDIDKQVVVVTGNNLKYENNNQVVTAHESLEYWEATKIAVARGRAVAIKDNRHIQGDVLTAEFRNQPNGKDQLYKMTAVGNVTVITKNDIVRGDKGVYDAARDIAIITGHVRITRPDGTLLTGDVGESDFVSNQSRLLNQGSGRVRALLPSKTSSKTAKPRKGTP
ncbi:MAG: LptA/OstA family protein [Bdellovibrionales bacterium]|jgi:lipopolysaccharide export system protein LptA